jgi:large subunit ribosomal protein L13
VKTYVPKQGELTKKWILIDAEGQVLGRVAAEAAKILRGKHKPQYTPYLDCGDHVIIINAAKARVTGNKAQDKMYYRHSGYPGGISETNYSDMLQRHPTRAMELAIKGMLPHNRLGRAIGRHLRVYADADHRHQAQNPLKLEINK